MRILNKNLSALPVSVVLFDFDGTLSTLRHGWEKVMEPLMVERLGEESRARVRAYIDESTGVQTIHQMKWLAGRISEKLGHAPDPWDLKAEYNRRLMVEVARRRDALRDGSATPDEYLIEGGAALLDRLRDRGIELLVASGTDDPDVKREADILGLSKYFKRIAGAPPGAEDCSKAAVLRELLAIGVDGQRLAVIGDGKVEIAIGRECGARTLGVASDEAVRHGIDLAKYERLIGAGADAIVGDYRDLDAIIGFLGLH